MQSGTGLPSEFWSKLEKRYKAEHVKSSTHGADAWEEEKPILFRALPAIQESLAPRYEIDVPIGVGGAGVVLKVQDLNLGIPCALKFPRPTPGKEQLFAEVLDSETIHLLKARHPNIAQIYYRNSIEIGGVRWPHYVMEFIQDATDALEFFKRQPQATPTVVNVLMQLVDGLAHLHSLAIVHCDVKLENALVGANGRTVLSDLGSARHLREGPPDVLVIFSRPHAHPKLISLVSATYTDPNRVRGPIKRFELRREFDLYALGKNLKRLLNLFDAAQWSSLEPYTRKYLDLMASRLLDGENTETECALGLPKEAFQEIKYRDCGDVAIDLRKLTGEYNLYKTVPELNPHPVKTVQTSSMWPTPFTDRLAKVIEHPVLRRLAGVSQLGLVALIYPTATHSRLEHVLGTFSNVIRYCDALYNDPVNPLFRQIMTESDLKAVLLAALLHDIGHYPLAHDLEEIDPTVFSHETLGKELLLGTGGEFDTASLKNHIEQSWGLSVTRVLDVIEVDPTDLTKSFKDRILHSILDGPIDADKIDYIVRDSINLNVPFGHGIDAARLLQCVTVVFSDEGGKVYGAVGIHEKGRIPAEAVAFARYALFGTVYWHHTSRAAKAMLRRALSDAREAYSEKRLVREFREMILARNSEIQQYLFRISETVMPPEASQVLPGDREQLLWLAKRSSVIGSRLVNMLLERNLYRRISVISSGRNRSLWDLVVKFADKHGPRGVLALEKYLQDQIIDAIRGIDPSQRTYSVLEPEATDKTLALHAEDVPLILIDIPTNRPGTQIPLEYLPEADRYETLQEWQEPHGLEDSVVWRELYDRFLEAIGKIRVFGHPEVFKTIKAAVKKPQLEQTIKAGIRTLSRRL